MKYNFPENFIFGTATSSFQIEMGTSDESRSTRSDWYRWVHDEGIISSHLVSGDLPENGDDFWDTYESDFELAKELGTTGIRMSLDWARLFPDDTTAVGSVVKHTDKGDALVSYLDEKGYDAMNKLSDPDAVIGYTKILEAAKSKGLKVFLTMYHWPLPLWLHNPIECHKDIQNSKEKGWVDPKTVEEFGKYSDFIIKTYSKYVYTWQTINEPESVSLQGYLLGDIHGFPPGINDLKLAFEVQRNLVFAHSVAYHNVKRLYDIPTGVGVSIPYIEPVNEESRDIASYMAYMYNDWYLNAALNGSFDNDLDMRIDENIPSIGGTDYLGIDYYQRMRVKYDENSTFAGLLNVSIEPCSECSDFGWDVYSPGIREVIKRSYEKYRKPIYILENGIADASDHKRPNFIRDHLIEVSRSVAEDNIPVMGYFHWSLLDNYEWSSGFSKRFGLYEVNYLTGERIKRNSAEVYSRICRTREIEV